MASIDKIHGTHAQFHELYKWVADNYPKYCRYFLSPPPDDGTVAAIANTPLKMDRMLWTHCPLDWVKERIQFMYNGSPWDVM